MDQAEESIFDQPTQGRINLVDLSASSGNLEGLIYRTIHHPISEIGSLFGASKDGWFSSVLSTGASEFCKAVPLFMRNNPKTLAFAALVHGLDQINSEDSKEFNALNMLLGAGKGILMKGAFSGIHAIDKRVGLGLAGRAWSTGISLRSLNAGMDLRNWRDDSGQLGLESGLATLNDTALSKASLFSDLLTFGGAHALYKGVSLKYGKSFFADPVKSQIAIGSTFGFSNGMVSEIHRQSSHQEDLNLTKIGMSGVVHALSMGMAARTAARLTLIPIEPEQPTNTTPVRGEREPAKNGAQESTDLQNSFATGRLSANSIETMSPSQRLAAERKITSELIAPNEEARVLPRSSQELQILSEQITVSQRPALMRTIAKEGEVVGLQYESGTLWIKTSVGWRSGTTIENVHSVQELSDGSVVVKNINGESLVTWPSKANVTDGAPKTGVTFRPDSMELVKVNSEVVEVRFNSKMSWLKTDGGWIENATELVGVHRIQELPDGTIILHDAAGNVIQTWRGDRQNLTPLKRQTGDLETSSLLQ